MARADRNRIVAALGRRQAARESFAAQAARVLVSTGIAEEAAPILSLFAIDLVLEGASRRLFLHDGFVETVAVPAAERAFVLAEWGRSVLGRARDDGWEEAASRLRPVLRNVWFGSEALVRRPAFDRHLAVFLSRGNGAYLCKADLRAFGVSADQAFAVAMRNLADLAPEEEVADGGDSAVRVKGAEPGALLLLKGWLKRRKAVANASVPSRDLLLLSGEAASPYPFWERTFARWDSAQQPVSPLLYTLRDSGELAPRLAMPGDTELALLAETYAAQSRALSASNRQIDIPIATHLRSNSTLTCTWQEGREALLPEVATVLLQRKRKSKGKATSMELQWEEMEYFVGSADVSLEPGMFPTRWRVPAWTGAQLDRARFLEHDEDGFIVGPAPEDDGE